MWKRTGVFVFLTLLATQLYAGQVSWDKKPAVDGNTLLYLPLDENSGTAARDSGGKGYDGKLFKNAKWVPGKFGSGLQFDGVGSYVGFSQQLPQMNKFTAQCWVKLTKSPESNDTRFLDSGPEGTRWLIGVGGDRFWGDVNDGDNHEVYSHNPAVLNQWYHVALTYDGPERTVRLYVNGILEDTARYNGGTGIIPPLRLEIGAAYNGTSCLFAGTVDEVMISNAVLTGREQEFSFLKNLPRIAWNLSANKEAQFQPGAAGTETSRGIMPNRQFPRVALRPDVRINPVDPHYWIAQDGKPGGYGFFPTIVRAKDGTLAAAWLEPAHIADPGVGRTACSYSTDGGKTWSKPADLVNENGRTEPGRMQLLSDGTIFASIAQGRTGSVFSTDNGRTWQKPDQNSRLFFPGNRGIIERPDGTLIGAGFSGGGRAARWRVKTDNGWETKAFFSPSLGQPDEWDLIDTGAPGELVAVMRHQYTGDYFFTSFSRDWGQTWERAKPSTIWHSPMPTRPYLRKLQDGTIVCAYSERANSRITLIPSFDGGKTWDNSHKMVMLDGHGKLGDFGYADIAWVEGNTYLAVTYDDGAILGTFIDGRFFRDVYDGVRLAADDAVRDFTVGQWSFNEDDPKIVYDSTGKNYGKLFGGVTRAPGKFGRALEFNGESAYVFINDSDTLRVPRLYTLECWVKPTAVDREQVIISKAPAYEFGLTQEGKMFYQTGSTRFTAATPLKTGQWQHICVVLDPKGWGYIWVNFYLNGRPDGRENLSSNGAADYTEAYLRNDLKITGGPMYHELRPKNQSKVGPNHFLNHLYLGRSRGPETRYFSGLIDEVAIHRGMGSEINVLDEFRNPAEYITALDRAYVPAGEIVSEPVRLLKGQKWGVLAVEADIPEGTAIVLDLLDAAGKPIRENVKAGDDLSGLKNTEIRLRAKLGTTNTSVTPVLHSAKVAVK